MDSLKRLIEIIGMHFPQELQLLPQWVGWCYSSPAGKGGKAQKVPMNPKTGGNAMSNKPTTWATFEDASHAAIARKWDGVGFMFHGSYLGVDLDNCRDPNTGEIDSPVLEICTKFFSYTEISPSGTGLHIICKGSLPSGVAGHRAGNVEVYGRGRFFTVTGNVYAHSQQLSDGTSQVLSLLGEKTPPVSTVKRAATQQIADCDVIESIERSSDAVAFSSLYKDIWRKEDGGYHTFPSQSEADFAFCKIVARWSEGDAEQIDRLYRQSGLFRPKWDEARGGKTYGALTILNALERASDETPAAMSVQPYQMIWQGCLLNLLPKALIALQYNPKTAKIDAHVDKLQLQAAVKDMPLFMKEVEKRGSRDLSRRSVSVSVARLLDIVLLEYAKGGGASLHLSFPLAMYMQYCGLSDERALRDQIKRDLEILAAVRCTFSGDQSTGIMKEQKILESGVVRRGSIDIKFAEGFHKQFLRRKMVMPYPTFLLQFNPHKELVSYLLLRKLCEYKNFENLGKNPKDRIISVKYLLEACPALPKIEDVRKEDRHVRERIIDPFIQGMNRLNDVLGYKFCHEGGEPLRLGEWPIRDYDSFSKLYITTFWRAYPVCEHKKPTKGTDDKNVPIAGYGEAPSLEGPHTFDNKQEQK